MPDYYEDASELVVKEILTWEDFGSGSRELAGLVADSGYEPTIVIAVARGGLIPAGALAYALGLKLADAINVEFYTDVHETLADPILLPRCSTPRASVGRSSWWSTT